MTTVAGVVLVALALASPAAAFERSESRAACRERAPLRKPFFGDTHVHTSYSFDAMGQGTRTTPRDAYRFARGEAIGLPPYVDGAASNSAQLRRPLDFAVVTDHSDLLGETQICQNPDLDGYDSLICTLVRRWPLLGYSLVNGYVYSNASPRRYSFCGDGGRACHAAARQPWSATQAAAEEFYDRTPSCAFTTFVGYEWTGMPDGNNIHRNIVFRNEEVQAAPTTYLETPTAEGLWRALSEECLDSGGRCDAIAIPHNSNVSNGLMFQTRRDDGSPIDADDARRRSRIETLVEITQHKGDSECRLNANDELCNFETVPWVRMMDAMQPSLWRPAPPRSFVRETLASGLGEQARVGVNPFKLGIIGSTDTHFSTPGMVDEDTHPGHGAGTVFAAHGIPPFPDDPRFNPGGLAVLWAEENSRDALFAAMRRREAYGTSGPRIVARFFGGWDYPDSMCDSASFAELGYQRGVPMGSDLPPRGSDAPPVFAVSALRDPGGGGAPSTPLQRIQIVKLWSAGGKDEQRVYEVAGTPENGAGVDLASCETHGAGADRLCAVWRDPDFDAAVPAAYYARIVENPSCRWNTYACNRNRVDCDRPETFAGTLQHCCDPQIPKTIQERAWTSPIWYTPNPAQRDSGQTDRARQ